MKKKILLGLICGILVLGLATGCGNSKTNDDVDTNNPNENKEQVKDNTNNNTDSSLLTGTYNVPIIPLQKSVFTKVYITYANPPCISKRKKMVAINHKLPNNGPIEEGQLKKAILVIDNITDKYEVIYLGYVDNDTVKYRSINIANGTIDDFTLDGGDLNG